MSRNREPVMVRAGTTFLPRHEAWLDPSPQRATRREATEDPIDRAVLYAMLALYVVGSVLTGWFLFVP